MMNGSIWLESAVGEGSTFHFTARFGRARGLDEAPESRLLPRLTDLPVLIVDDNATNRRLLDEMLSNWRMPPTCAARGLAARRDLEEAHRRGEAAGLGLP